MRYMVIVPAYSFFIAAELLVGLGWLNSGVLGTGMRPVVLPAGCTSLVVAMGLLLVFRLELTKRLYEEN